MDPQTLATIFGAGGIGALLITLAKGIFNWLSGRAGRERTRNTSLEAQRVKAILERDAAEKERDTADAQRRIYQEGYAALKRQLIENGIKPYDWPGVDTMTRPPQ